MWPDDRLVPFPDDRLDPDLAELGAALEAAGQRASASAAPSRAFARDLRSRLLATYGAVPASTPVATSTTDIVRPRVTRRRRPVAATTRRVPWYRSSVWTGLAAAAVVVLAVLTLGGDRGFPVPSMARAIDAVGATVERDGSNRPLLADTQLLQGDIVRTSEVGSATLDIGGGETRLGPAASLRLDALGSDVRLAQLAGRAWHRVGASVGTYVVATADVTWTATSTAFDLDRHTTDAGVEQVRAVGVQHQVRIDGPTVSAILDEGQVATIDLSGPAADRSLAISPMSAFDRDDPWLLGNARRDAALGFAVGAFAEALVEDTDSPAPTIEELMPTEAPAATDAAPTASPTTSDAPRRTPGPTPKPTPAPTPRPTAKPTPKPTPKPPSLGTLGLTVTACHGGFSVLDWTAAPESGFDHYQSMRSSSSSIPPVEPPQPPAVAPDSLYAPSWSTRRALDTGLEPGVTYHYRTVAFKTNGAASAASPVRATTAKAVKSLGALSASYEVDSVHVSWTPYSGPEACFTWYKLVASTTDPTPGYGDGAETIWGSGSQGESGAYVGGLASGTYYLRLETLRANESGVLSVARSEVATVTVP